MGYWVTNELGNSFTDSYTGIEMVWGDCPADVMGEAVKEIIRIFYRDMGRPPLFEELTAGLLFSASAALENFEEERQAVGLSTYEAVYEFIYGDEAADDPDLCSTFFEAISEEDARRQWDAKEAESAQYYAAKSYSPPSYRRLVSLDRIEPGEGHPHIYRAYTDEDLDPDPMNYVEPCIIEDDGVD